MMHKNSQSDYNKYSRCCVHPLHFCIFKFLINIRGLRITNNFLVTSRQPILMVIRILTSCMRNDVPRPRIFRLKIASFSVFKYI